MIHAPSLKVRHWENKEPVFLLPAWLKARRVLTAGDKKMRGVIDFYLGVGAAAKAKKQHTRSTRHSVPAWTGDGGYGGFL